MAAASRFFDCGDARRRCVCQAQYLLSHDGSSDVLEMLLHDTAGGLRKEHLKDQCVRDQRQSYRHSDAEPCISRVEMTRAFKLNQRHLMAGQRVHPPQAFIKVVVRPPSGPFSPSSSADPPPSPLPSSSPHPATLLGGTGS